MGRDQYIICKNLGSFRIFRPNFLPNRHFGVTTKQVLCGVFGIIFRKRKLSDDTRVILAE